jgi:hypothetical protein
VLAIGSKDNLLLAVNEGSGTIVLVGLASNQVTGRINAVRSELPGDEGGDDHSDHGSSHLAPVISSVAPLIVSANATFTLTVTGATCTAPPVSSSSIPPMSTGKVTAIRTYPAGTRRSPPATP